MTERVIRLDVITDGAVPAPIDPGELALIVEQVIARRWGLDAEVQVIDPSRGPIAVVR